MWCQKKSALSERPAVQRMNGGSVWESPTCVGSVSDSSRSRGYRSTHSSLPLHFQELLQPYQPLSLYPLSLSLSFSLLLLPPHSLIVSPHITLLSLSLAFSSPSFSFLPLPLLVWKGGELPLSSPPLSPLLPLSLTTFSPKSFNGCVNFSSSIVDYRLSTPHWPLLTHTTQYFLAPVLWCTLSDVRGVELLNNGSKIEGEMRNRAFTHTVEFGQRQRLFFISVVNSLIGQWRKSKWFNPPNPSNSSSVLWQIQLWSQLRNPFSSGQSVCVCVCVCVCVSEMCDHQFPQLVHTWTTREVSVTGRNSLINVSRLRLNEAVFSCAYVYVCVTGNFFTLLIIIHGYDASQQSAYISSNNTHAPPGPPCDLVSVWIRHSQSSKPAPSTQPGWHQPDPDRRLWNWRSADL